MKTALFAPMFLDGNDPHGTPRLWRNTRYIQYYQSIQPQLGFDTIYFADNASSIENLKMIGGRIDFEDTPGKSLFNDDFPNSTGVHIFTYRDRLHGGMGWVNYPYCWRALYFIQKLILRGYEKIITIDSDGFITSRRMAKYVKDLKSGWTSFYCPRHNFPDCSIHVLCADQFWAYQEFTWVPYMTHMGKLMETSLPFTHVERGFNTDRFGEFRSDQPEGCDYFGQAHIKVKLEYGRDY